MNMKKLTAAAICAAAAASAVSLGVSADEPVKAIICYTDVNWSFTEMGSYDNAAEITGDGQYTITTTVPAGTEEIGVFCIDCEGMFAAYPDAAATLDSIEIDGAAISFDASKIIYGDIEEKGNYRIEIYNIYGDTKDNPGINAATPINESLSVTFTVSGMGGAAAEAPAETEAPASDNVPASDSTTTAAETGNAAAVSIAAVLALAGAAAIVSKKR